jgi:hypothetical protein
MTFSSPLKFNENGYSIRIANVIMYSSDEKKRYRIIKNPSILTQIYYLTFADHNNLIHVKLYPWDRKIIGLDDL